MAGEARHGKDWTGKAGRDGVRHGEAGEAKK